MGDAEIIPIGTRGRPGRGTGTQPSSAARSLAPRSAGSTPAKQAASARRPEQPGQPEQPDEPRGPTETAGSVPPGEPTADPAPDAQHAAEPTRAPATTRERNPLGNIPAAELLGAFQNAAMELFGDQWEPRLAAFLAFLRRRVTGDYVVDEYGFDAEVTQRFMMTALRPIAQKWFRIDVRGVENIPTEGGALVVSNHSGTVPIDGLMTMVVDPRPHRSPPAPAGRRPGLPDAGREHDGPQERCDPGLQRGRRADAARRRAGRGVARGLQGHRQAVRRALQAPALRPRRLRLGGAAHRGADRPAGGRRRRGDLPAASATCRRWPGCSACPTSRSRRSSRCSGPLGLVPLPSKWLLEFGEPIRTDDYDEGAADDPMLVFDVTDQVRETIQQTLYTLLMQRQSVFG